MFYAQLRQKMQYCAMFFKVRRDRRACQMQICESSPGSNCLCIISPPAGKITLHDLKKCKLANVFFDTFFNIEKYLDHEQKEQVSLLRVSVARSTWGAGRVCAA